MIRFSVKLLSSVLFILFIAFACQAQNEFFANNYVGGTIILKDSTIRKGQLKWLAGQFNKVKFKASEDADVLKYDPDDLIGFKVDTLTYVSLYDFDAYSDNYTLIGKTTKIKKAFGEILHKGHFNIYLVLITGYNPVSQSIQYYPNIVFERVETEQKPLISFPYSIRMKEGKYEKAKEALCNYFKDYPEVVVLIKSFRRDDNFDSIIEKVKQL
ncbi:hypothetical protein F0919_03600 [Taibaiella lutea]|uniref:Uncharacterized protein n=1 Tax=Taibaiella lutea TaxID=2608001 RepID=A0A5M6CNV7_9BACT|nr:hypothetical protein [Taibaiella lutea]KAA5536767.1 hypothetical protein F0919_03600 [Taibaiella lutea]